MRWLLGLALVFGPPAHQWCSAQDLVIDGQIGNIESLAFSPDGSHLAFGNGFGRWKLWSLVENRERFGIKEHEVELGFTCVAFSPDGKTVALGGDDCKVRFCDTANGKHAAAAVETEVTVCLLAYSPNGKMLAAAGGMGQVMAGPCDPRTAAFGFLKLWNVESGRDRVKLGWQKYIRTFSFSPDGSMLAFGGQRGSLTVLEVSTAKVRASLDKGQQSAVIGLAFPGGGRTVASADEDGAVTFWDLFTGEGTVTPKCPGRGFTLAAMTKDGTLVAFYEKDETVKLFDTVIGREVFAAKARVKVRAMTFSPDGRRLAIAESKVVRIWDVERHLKQVRPLEDIGARPAESQAGNQSTSVMSLRRPFSSGDAHELFGVATP